jgi:hypothetical protein
LRSTTRRSTPHRPVRAADDGLQDPLPHGDERPPPAGDENSRALPFKGTTYDVAFPIQKGDGAWGTNFITRQKMTVQQVNDAVSDMLTADVNWMRDHILAGLFYNGAGWTVPRPEWGDLTIQGLANGDTVTVYVKQGGPGDGHPLLRAGRGDCRRHQPLRRPLRRALRAPGERGRRRHHLHRVRPGGDDGSAGVNFAPVADANVQTGSADAVAIGRPGMPPSPPVGPSARPRRNQWVAEWPAIPSGYGVTLATGGPRPLAMRQDPEPELQGFVQADNREDFPYQEAQFFRRAGFGAWNRVGAVAFRIGNASWAIPTSFGSPMY